MTGFLTAAPAHAARVQVLVTGPYELTDASAAAQALLTPAAGPTTSREQALAALVRGRVRNTLLSPGDEGPPLIAVGPRPGADITITVELPPPGEQRNDKRYRLTIDGGGYEGVLTSTSTRIPGLVSIADVAPTVLALERGDEPPIREAVGAVRDLAALDDWIRAKNSVRLPLMIVASAAVALAALRRPRLAPAALASLLLLNVAAGFFAVPGAWRLAAAALALAAAAVPWLPRVDAGTSLAGAVLAYLAALGVDGPAVALSPLGPTQNARFYGLSNVLATFLTAAAVAAAALLARRYGPVALVAVGVAAFVVVAGSRFGADGGGAVVLAAGFAVLAVLLYPRRWPLVATLVLVATAALFLLDLTTGGESHVTRALDNGVWDDLVRRAHLSWERATDSWLDALYLGALLVALLALVLRCRRHVIVLSLGVALLVSLAVNDSPNEVLVPGVACLFGLSKLRFRESAAGS